ncbi:MAG: hypothetical protein Q8843_02640, partial [Candidatus Phytoplasma australasiaticum]|nr:hypothetical protein [Candidatus Phytoplasma australasiaticum]
YSLKRELQQGMNNFYNTLMAFNKIATNKGAGTPGIDNKTIDGIKSSKIKKIPSGIRQQWLSSETS